MALMWLLMQDVRPLRVGFLFAEPFFFLIFPVLLFLDVFVSLVFFLPGISLVFLGVFCLFSKVFRGSPGEKNP